MIDWNGETKLMKHRHVFKNEDVDLYVIFYCYLNGLKLGFNQLSKWGLGLGSAETMTTYVWHGPDMSLSWIIPGYALIQTRPCTPVKLSR